MNKQRNAVGWFEIYVNDMARARAFYETTFQLKLEPLPYNPLEMLVFSGEPDRPGCNGALVKMEGKGGGAGGIIIYFSCLDCAEEAARAAAAGGKIFKPKLSIGEYGFISLIFDTEENMIGLHSMK